MMFNRIGKVKPEKAFIILALIYGLSFLIINPPFQAMDEEIHFLRAADISDGHLMPEKVDNKSVVVVTSSIRAIISEFPGGLVTYPNKKISIKNIISGLRLPLNKDVKGSMDIAVYAIVSYPPIPYLASALGICLGKFFNFPPLVLMYLGRLMNFILWFLIIYMAIKITPIHKWVFLLLSLMPMTIFQGSSLSADSFTIALSFLIIAAFLKFAFDHNKKLITKKDIFILFTLILMLALSKPVYSLLMFLFFLIPSYKFGNRNKMYLTFIILFIPLVVIESIWYLTAGSLYVPENAHTSISGQISFILSNPAVFPHIMVNTLWGSTYTYLKEFVGHLGWVVFLPDWLVVLYFTVLVSVSLLDKNKIIISLKQKIVIATTLFAILFAIFAVEYITWTPLGESVIGGVQGRYFIPVAPLLFLLFYNKRIYWKHLNVFIIIFIIFSLLIALFEVVKTSYI